MATFGHVLALFLGLIFARVSQGILMDTRDATEALYGHLEVSASLGSSGPQDIQNRSSEVKNHDFDPKIEFRPPKYHIFMRKITQGHPEDEP